MAPPAVSPLMSDTCRECGADSGTIGMVAGVLLGEQHPCPACMSREGVALYPRAPAKGGDDTQSTTYVVTAGRTVHERAAASAPTADLIAEECDALKALLLQKNAAYGDSAIRPLRIFSKADPEEQIRVRLDDKISRLARGSAAGEDVIQDLLGYLILLRVARRAKT